MHLYGKNSVLERIISNPGSIKSIFLQDNFASPRIIEAIRSKEIPVKRVSERELSKIKHADRLQGIVARVEEFRYTPFDELLNNAAERNLSLIFLDSINDPHNLGSILRITACFGDFAVVIPKHSSCEVNDTVVHVASGGENFVPVSMVNNMTTAIIKAKNAGYWIVGAMVEQGADITGASLPFPIGLVLGSEGKGIRHGVKKHLDQKVSLPMRGADLSFNVAVACAIFSYEISKQRDIKHSTPGLDKRGCPRKPGGGMP
ncbi:MAG: 23S rRNA (guanosine(2251)-2'-O)-methyltransferase RlmB [Candidatus Omnitrophota bacterium]